MLFQVLINSLIIGSIYAIIAVGFTLTYFTTKFLNFGHGATILISAYSFFYFYNKVGWLGSIILTILIAILFNILTYIIFYKKTANKASKVILLLLSFAILIATEAIIQIIFSASPQRINIPFAKSITIFNAVITKTQIAIIISAILILIISYLVFKKTKIGLAIRAVSENNSLAEIYGINSEKIKTYSFVIAAILAAIAGIIITLEYVLTPTLGSYYMIKGFVGAVTGGLNTIYGAIFGSYLLGIFENYGVWFLSSSYQDAIAFTLLFLILLIKPNGLFGKNKGVRE